MLGSGAAAGPTTIGYYYCIWAQVWARTHLDHPETKKGLGVRATMELDGSRLTEM